MTLSSAIAPGVLWKGTKNVNVACCEVTHKPHARTPDRVRFAASLRRYDALRRSLIGNGSDGRVD